jgi:hypothetical protein
MKYWRISKYNPIFRDDYGAYRREDWTSFDDIGRVFNGTLLTLADYIQMEDRYVSTALHFAHGAGILELIASEVELRRSNLGVSEGMHVSINRASEIIKTSLRSFMWCKLELPFQFYLHFGYDYYMYIGNQFPLPESVEFAEKCGLFVEECKSPYLRWDLHEKKKDS